MRTELARSADTAGIGHVTPHQLRHTYATALVNAGVSLQALMALLGHASAEMSLRYAHLFDSTVRAEYERALDLAKGRIGAMPHRRAGRASPSPPTPAAPPTTTGATRRPSKHASPAATAYAPPPKEPAPTPTSASTAPASAPTPRQPGGVHQVVSSYVKQGSGLVCWRSAWRCVQTRSEMRRLRARMASRLVLPRSRHRW